jgi:hypothetical protein
MDTQKKANGIKVAIYTILIIVGLIVICAKMLSKEESAYIPAKLMANHFWPPDMVPHPDPGIERPEPNGPVLA